MKKTLHCLALKSAWNRSSDKCLFPYCDVYPS